MLPDNATDKSVTWASSASDVATVSATGLVTAKKKGTTNITVTSTDGAKVATCALTVNDPVVAVTGVSLNKTTTSLAVGATETLTATVAPSNATNKAVTWATSAASIVTVANGKITAVAEGSADIIVTTTDGKKTAKCTITVTASTGA